MINYVLQVKDRIQTAFPVKLATTEPAGTNTVQETARRIFKELNTHFSEFIVKPGLKQMKTHYERSPILFTLTTLSLTVLCLYYLCREKVNYSLPEGAVTYNGKYNDKGLPEGSGIATYPNEDRYEGSFDEGKRRFWGKLTTKNGDMYEGGFEDDKFKGFGVMIRGDKKYTGDWENNELVKGEVEQRDSNGDYSILYRGEFQNYIFHGKGTHYVLNEQIKMYVGNFQYGRYHGSGTIWFANGDKYEGEFFEGNIQGNGTFTSSNGEIRTGNFVDGQLTGQGKRILGNDLYEGEFLYGRLTGKGTHKKLNLETAVQDDKVMQDFECIYEGYFRDDSYEGTGKLMNDGCGNSYSGEFLHGFYHGKGELKKINCDVYYSGKFAYGRFLDGDLKYDNGDIFSGAFESGNLVKGVMTFADGNVYTGGFQSDLFHGYGELKKPSGKTYKGEFFFGMFAGYYTNSEGKRCPGELHYPNGHIYRGEFDLNHSKGAAVDNKPHGSGVLVLPASEGGATRSVLADKNTDKFTAIK